MHPRYLECRTSHRVGFPWSPSSQIVRLTLERGRPDAPSATLVLRLLDALGNGLEELRRPFAMVRTLPLTHLDDDQLLIQIDQKDAPAEGAMTNRLRAENGVARWRLSGLARWSRMPQPVQANALSLGESMVGDKQRLR